MLSPPPRDQSGNVIPHDHQEISAEDGIIRRISQQQVVPGKDGKPTLSTLAVNPSSLSLGGGMSVDLQTLIESKGVEPRSFVTQPPFIGSIRFTTQFLRSMAFQVGYDPCEDNPYHGEVWGNFSNGRKKELLRNSEWFVPINGVTIPA